MLEISSLAFLETQNVPDFKLPTFVKALSIFVQESSLVKTKLFFFHFPHKSLNWKFAFYSFLTLSLSLLCPDLTEMKCEERNSRKEGWDLGLDLCPLLTHTLSFCLLGVFQPNSSMDKNGATNYLWITPSLLPSKIKVILSHIEILKN